MTEISEFLKRFPIFASQITPRRRRHPETSLASIISFVMRTECEAQITKAIALCHQVNNPAFIPLIALHVEFRIDMVNSRSWSSQRSQQPFILFHLNEFEASFHNVSQK
jgi:hypothetical protein